MRSDSTSASATAAPFLGHVRAWVGLGDQTSPPDDILSEAGDIFEATDGWRGRTVLWLALECGTNRTRAERWPRTPPEVEVEMDWSLVWDPRDAGQDPADPSTWTYSANQALCLLDALRWNPIRRYRLAHLDIPSFEDGADVADQAVARYYAGGSEARYETHGALIWDGREIVEQVTPLAEAGAGRLIRIGARLGYAAGAWRAPVYTATDLLEEGGVDFRVMAPGRELPPALKVAYISPERDWQEAETDAMLVPGASAPVDEDGVREHKLAFCTSPTQAQRVQKIEVQRLGAQKRLTCTLPPSAIVLAGGSTLTMDLPAPFTRLNGLYEVRAARPATWINEGVESGVALRLPVELIETAEAHYAWDPETDEVEVTEGEEVDPLRPIVPAPLEITATTGATAALGDMPRIRYEFPQASLADWYEVQVWIDGDLPGAVERLTDIDGGGDVYGFVAPAIPNALYHIRVRTARERGRGVAYSDWVETTVTALPPTLDLDAPTSGAAVGGAGQIDVSFKAPNSADFKALEFWGGPTSDIEDAALLDKLFGAPREVMDYSETGLGAGVTRWYWARSTGPYGSASPFTAAISATTDP